MQQKDMLLLRFQICVNRPLVSSPWLAQLRHNWISCGQSRALGTQVARFFLKLASSSNHFALYLWMENRRNNIHSPNRALIRTN